MSGSLKSLDSLFTRQLYEWDCGPVAVLNAISWALCSPVKHKRKARSVVKNWLKTDKHGTYDRDMTRVLKAVGKKYRFDVTYEKNMPDVGFDGVKTELVTGSMHG